jgi:hypothetical protein
MTTQTPCADGATLSGAFGAVPESWHGRMGDSVALPDYWSSRSRCRRSPRARRR